MCPGQVARSGQVPLLLTLEGNILPLLVALWLSPWLPIRSLGRLVPGSQVYPSPGRIVLYIKRHWQAWWYMTMHQHYNTSTQKATAGGSCVQGQSEQNPASKVFIMFYFAFYVSVLSTCMCMHHVHIYCMWRPQKDIRSPGTRVTDHCEPPAGCWDWTRIFCERSSALSCWSILPAPFKIVNSTTSAHRV